MYKLCTQLGNKYHLDCTRQLLIKSKINFVYSPVIYINISKEVKCTFNIQKYIPVTEFC